MLTITGLPAFTTNYIWMLANTKNQTCYVVDPGDAEVVENACRQQQLTLAGILVTHHHADHTGGIAALLNNRDIPVYGPADENIPGLSHPLRDQDTFNLLGVTWQVLATPGHTNGHLCYFAELEHDNPVLFSGDTLFSAGCGRIFEGTHEQMLDSLTRLGTFPHNTLVFCAHEYTQTNLEFALSVEPKNRALQQRIREVSALRTLNQPSVPSLLSVERATNPFLRTANASVIAAASRYSGRSVKTNLDCFTIIRQWKDGF